jgi:hypothetical protein
VADNFRVQLRPNLRKVVDTFESKKRDHTVPASYLEFRAGFYFCRRLIQFMQQVYYDRQLESNYAAPTNRGWMNLFRRAAWSRMLRFTWTMTAGTYGARFQSFCEHHLYLESGDPKFSEEPLKICATLSEECDEIRVNFDPPDNTWESEDLRWRYGPAPSCLHHYETCLIKEFIASYVYHDKFECSKSVTFQVFPLQVEADNPISGQPDDVMWLNAGFLIAGPGRLENERLDCRNAILYFRTRPSMRNMDLARKAFLECHEHKVLADYPIQLVDDLGDVREETKATKTTWERRACWDVHHMDRESLDHCRWFSQLLEEVAEDDNKGVFEI